MNLNTIVRDADTRLRISGIESDMVAGVKRTPADLEWYCELKREELTGVPHWRHKESSTVYHVVGVGLASTGRGTLALMVHYKAIDERGSVSGPRFERQEPLFRERFEPVVSRTVWDAV